MWLHCFWTASRAVHSNYREGPTESPSTYGKVRVHIRFVGLNLSFYGLSARSVDPKFAQGSIDRAERSMDFACDTNHCIIIGASNIYIDRLVIQVH